MTYDIGERGIQRPKYYSYTLKMPVFNDASI
jgi:hypothetical protein